MITLRPWAFLAPVLLLAASFTADAQRLEATEPSVKAAFLYKFAAYIEWPPASFAASDAPFVIGVVDSEKVAVELEKIVASRRFGTHPVAVRRLKEDEPARGVHLLFVGQRAGEHLSSIVRAAQPQGSLVVTEGEHGLESGSAINFVVANDHVGFEVSTEAAERSGHRISSRMLAVARRVVKKGT